LFVVDAFHSYFETAVMDNAADDAADERDDPAGKKTAGVETCIEKDIFGDSNVNSREEKDNSTKEKTEEERSSSEPQD
jgi:hypothetical protein